MLKNCCDKGGVDTIKNGTNATNIPKSQTGRIRDSGTGWAGRKNGAVALRGLVGIPSLFCAGSAKVIQVLRTNALAGCW